MEGRRRGTKFRLPSSMKRNKQDIVNELYDTLAKAAQLTNELMAHVDHGTIVADFRRSVVSALDDAMDATEALITEWDV